eukprot:scaffold2636_cov176-Ochromonas_danica.AAC.8
MYFATQTLLCYRLISRVVVGQCPQGGSSGLTFNCNPMHKVHSLPPEICILLMLIPLLFAMQVRGAHLEFSIILWLMALASMAFSVGYDGADNAIMFVIYYAIGSFLLLVSAGRMNLYLFFSHLKLRETFIENEKAADVAQALELRHMIGNVAHDLKTPLSSFWGGIEYISQVMKDVTYKHRQQHLSRSDMEDFIQSISSCVTNMRNTNSFMLMTINRCIDYTKASKGVKLVPKFETMDLMETLSLPLNCMKDIQQRVSIVLEAVSREICSHIITDKQWLQENVLCLLSNAVKYSNEGEVVIRVTKEVAYANSALIDENNKKGGSVDDLDSKTGLAFVNTFRIVPSAKVYCSTDLVEDDAGEEFLKIEVEDHGIGLSEDAMANLFTPFKQAQRLAGGTGLGLFSLAKRIEALDGKCGVERRRDGLEGSLFWFMIPYRPDNTLSSSTEQCCSPKRDEPVVVVAEQKSSPSSRKSLKRAFTEGVRPLPTLDADEEAMVQRSGKLDILVVDDSPAVLKMTTMMLRRHKHIVITATNGAEAVKKVNERISIRGSAFDIILMDLQMPVMDGLEATRRLRALEKSGIFTSLPRTRTVSASSELNILEQGLFVEDMERPLPPLYNLIIGVSANSDDETAKAAQEVGMDAFISKPFNLDTFYKIYEWAVTHRKQLPLEAQG